MHTTWARPRHMSRVSEWIAKSLIHQKKMNTAIKLQHRLIKIKTLYFFQTIRSRFSQWTLLWLLKAQLMQVHHRQIPMKLTALGYLSLMTVLPTTVGFKTSPCAAGAAGSQSLLVRSSILLIGQLSSSSNIYLTMSIERWKRCYLKRKGTLMWRS